MKQTVFLETLDALKHIKGFKNIDTPVLSGPVKKAIDIYNQAHVQKKSINSFIQPKINVSTPFHALQWQDGSYVCDENVSFEFGGIRPTKSELKSFRGISEETERISTTLDPIIIASLSGETSNDGRILRFAGHCGKNLVTSDIIMALRFKILFPKLSVVIPSLGWLVMELIT